MIDLTGLAWRAIEPSLVEFGGIQRGSLGGPSQNLQRLGNRYSFALAPPTLAALTPWTGRIVAAKQQGALIRITEPGYAGGAGGAPVVAAAVAGGTSVTIGGLSAGFTIAPGKWLSFIHGGVRYAHLVAIGAVAAGGQATVTVTPMLRTPLSVGDLVEIAQPKAQGLLVDRLSWSVGETRLVGFTLQLEEQK